MESEPRTTRVICNECRRETEHRELHCEVHEEQLSEDVVKRLELSTLECSTCGDLAMRRYVTMPCEGRVGRSLQYLPLRTGFPPGTQLWLEGDGSEIVGTASLTAEVGQAVQAGQRRVVFLGVLAALQAEVLGHEHFSEHASYLAEIAVRSGLLTVEQGVCIDQCGHSFPRLSDFEVRDLESLIEWDLSDPEIQDLDLDLDWGHVEESGNA